MILKSLLMLSKWWRWRITTSDVWGDLALPKWSVRKLFLSTGQAVRDWDWYAAHSAGFRIGVEKNRLCKKREKRAPFCTRRLLLLSCRKCLPHIGGHTSAGLLTYNLNLFDFYASTGSLNAGEQSEKGELVTADYYKFHFRLIFINIISRRSSTEIAFALFNPVSFAMAVASSVEWRIPCVQRFGEWRVVNSLHWILSIEYYYLDTIQTAVCSFIEFYRMTSTLCDRDSMCTLCSLLSAE